MIPRLDLSAVLTDPMLASSFDITRRDESAGANGRITVATTVFPGQVGVVTPADPDELDRGADGEAQTRSINVRTRFPLRDRAEGVLPDLVTYDGAVYEVKNSKPWRFGSGWYTAKCSTIAAQDPPNT